MINLQWQSSDSSNIEQFAYDDTAEELHIIFRSNQSHYMYQSVPQEVYEGLLKAESHGKYFHANIKHNYIYSIMH
jgi:uncharacterized protein